ncbi:hypothetical protein C6496_02395 [Candidatus Poribacteria bacterium]|nr:MAG: hypothetical protein C6496_02395 [Candidatus Poribacteria bacterium]
MHDPRDRQGFQFVVGQFIARPSLARSPNLASSSSQPDYTVRNGSDIDLTLYGDALTHSILSRIDTELDDLLLPYTIDLSIFHQIDNPAMVEQIQRIGVNFYEKYGEV